jgi:peptide/nickel transport system substrate-binding protein
MREMPWRAGAARRSAIAILALLALAPAGPQAAARDLVEPPMLAKQVQEGKLPPIGKRAPKEPRVVRLDGPGLAIGRHGGQLNQLMERATDIRRLSAYGYSRLVGYNDSYRLEPDILRSFEVKEGREFTFVLRKGHRWSDGKPFTTEDFRYFWEDMAQNERLVPEGPPKEMMVEGRPPRVEVVDEVTIRYVWEKPNPYFLPALAAATPLNIYRPAHYLKRFHEKHQKPERLKAEIEKRKRRDWVDLHFNRDRMHRLDNPDFPVLDPWVNTTPSPADRYIFVRNPYYHRVDSEGRQLPYIDEVAITIAASKLIPAKVGAGEVELQSRGLQFNNYTLLKRAEARHDYKVHLWKQARGAQIALFPNLNATDPEWRRLNRDVRYRRALSLAINRREVNQVIYFGLGKESANTVLPESPFFRPELQSRWSAFDLKTANRLLDELGLKERDGRGIRKLPDGRPLEIIVETAGEGSEHSDVLELVRDSWAEAGIALFVKPQTREVLRRRVSSGAAAMSVFFGIDNGVAHAGFAPFELAPTNEDQLAWPQFGMHYTSNGKQGQAPDIPEVRRLVELYGAWSRGADEEARGKVWREMLAINSEQVFSIGIVNAVPQPIVVSNKLRNVPVRALYTWEPGGHFGVFRPDTFWLDAPARGS